MAKRKIAPAVTAFTALFVLLGVLAAPAAAHALDSPPAVEQDVTSPAGTTGGGDVSEDPSERLPTTGSPLTTPWLVGTAALLTGALVAMALRGRRRMLRGATYW